MRLWTLESLTLLPERRAAVVETREVAASRTELKKLRKCISGVLQYGSREFERWETQVK